MNVTFCANCKHKPVLKAGFIDFPDYICPCRNEYDPDTGWIPDDTWFCPLGEPKEAAPGDSLDLLSALNELQESISKVTRALTISMLNHEEKKIMSNISDDTKWPESELKRILMEENDEHHVQTWIIPDRIGHSKWAELRYANFIRPIEAEAQEEQNEK